MTTYRTPDPAWCGLTERPRRFSTDDDYAADIYDENDRIVMYRLKDAENVWLFPVWLNDPYGSDEYQPEHVHFRSFDDALVAWCLATGRRHLVVVPTWQELGATDTFGTDFRWNRCAGRITLHTEMHARHIDVTDELDARFTCAVLQALEAGL